ncbi:ribose-5-phosphate isomerase RpiA [Sulfobacillus harzensis]|uniref:Ribose 5-phosphate isomerase A n=1 Tax=Sulfobacillus harzensis TaxID=2729629 RepID=A0A7Y0L3Y0_9FIRM|nr:ribose-5-phosphate isomerase RpiA [Sulfobacillus harzensis]NMP21459.1 ribose-5-phosphate isomerase RpiA [Sulfobacillus harzensis]
MEDPWHRAKEALGRWAAQQIQDVRILGIGSGSTVSAFIQALARYRQEVPMPLTITAASHASEEQARQLGLDVVPLESLEHVDLAVDGADAVDAHGALIKGGGAALVRERLVIAAARHTMILVDSSKVMNAFKRVRLPIAIIPFGWRQTLSRLNGLGVGTASLRRKGEGPVVTDDGLYIADLAIGNIAVPDMLHHELKRIDGVVDTGLFLDYPTAIWVSDGLTVWRHNETGD